MHKPFVPTAEQRQNVEAMTGFGIALGDIARLIKNPATGKPLDLKTLHKHFADEIVTGQTKAVAEVLTCAEEQINCAFARPAPPELRRSRQSQCLDSSRSVQGNLASMSAGTDVVNIL